MVKFAHIADCHLGAFARNPQLREYNLQAFEKAVDISIERDVDFMIIAGDLFHNPHPDMDVVNRAVKSLMKARKKEIRIYSVYGSHDFNISRASLIDVLESAEVFKKVVNYLEGENRLALQEDPSGVSIAGLSGRKNRADVSYFEELEFSEPEGESVFVFHTPIAELKPADIHEERSVPLSLLPKNFSYYAGGHIHRRIEDEERSIYYPGPTFGDSYTDLERDERGFFIVDDWEAEYVEMKEPKIKSVKIDADELKIEELKERLRELYEKDMQGDILLLKIFGTLAEGLPTDINFTEVKKRLKEKGFETVYLNRRGLEGKEIERVKVKEESDEDFEKRLMEEYSSEEFSTEFRGRLLNVLKEEQKEGESSSDYEERIWTEAWNLIQKRDEYEDKEDQENGEEEEKKGGEEKSDDVEEQKKERKKDGQISLSDFGGGDRCG